MQVNDRTELSMLFSCDASRTINPHTVKLQRQNWQPMMIISARKSSRGKGFRTEWRMSRTWYKVQVHDNGARST